MAHTIRPASPQHNSAASQSLGTNRTLPAARPEELANVARDASSSVVSTSQASSMHNAHSAALEPPRVQAQGSASQERGLAPPFLAGYYKGSLPYEEYEDVVGLRVVHLLEPDGASARYLVTETQIQGTYGKVKYACDAYGRRVALKEMRLTEPRRSDELSKFGLTKTLVMSAEDVRDEADRTAVCRAVIESFVAARVAVNRGRDPLEGLRTSLTPFRVLEVLQADDKIEMVMTPASGDLYNLSGLVAPSERAGFAVSAAAQIALELAGLHAAGFAHLDLKPENILFTRAGQVMLGDFGMARARLAGETHLGLRGPVGTTPAPDMLLTDDDLDEDGNWQSVLLTQATDVWLAAITMLQLVHPAPPHENPMLYQRDANGQIDHVATSTRLAHFEVWRREAIDERGHVRPEALLGRDIFSRYFRGVHATSPELCQILLSKALIARVDLRASAHDMARVLETLATSLAPEQKAEARGVFARGHDAMGQDAAFEAIDRYQTWFAQRRA